MKSNKNIIVVGDRILIKPDEARDKTAYGLYLPQGVESKEKVQGGYVVKVGPGYPLPDLNSMSEKPWEKSRTETQYLPLQAEEGDYALFLRKACVEIEFDGEKYVIVSQAGILLLIRDDILKHIDENSD